VSRRIRHLEAHEEGVTNNKLRSILVDHTTSRPSLAVEIYNQAKALGIGSIDAPVSGGDVGAREGKLVVMCGGEKEDLERVQPIMEKYSRAVNLSGGAGLGQHTKMVNQIVLAGNMAGTVEGLMYASKSGLNLAATIDTIILGAASSTALNVLGRRMVAGNFDPGFYVEHYIKDLEICL
jgi:3-hydroxyisobutyrate dehydrogenase